MVQYQPLSMIPGQTSNAEADSIKQTARTRHWQPWSTKAPFLITYVLLCVALAASAEVLLRVSQSQGGLMFSKSGDLSTLNRFSFRYMPAIVAVLFGLLWATAGHDFKRLEPFFQLSKQAGATAKDSLLLDYPYVLTPLLPYESLKRRHWTVFYSSIISLLTVFFLLPTMTTMIDQRRLLKTITDDVSVASLPASMDANSPLSTDHAYLAYDYAWLGGPLPNFTTLEYTLLPLVVPDAGKKNETWAVDTVLYEADLQCKEATFIEKSYGFDITDNEGCTWSWADSNSDIYLYKDVYLDGPMDMAGAQKWGSYFMGHADVMKPDSSVSFYRGSNDYYTLASNLSDCTDQRKFLAMWTAGHLSENCDPRYTCEIPHNNTAIFCTPSYWSQDVKANLSISAVDSSIRVNKVDRVGDRLPFDSNFNSAGFEDLVATGFTSTNPEDNDGQGRVVSLGYFPPEYPDPSYRFSKKYGDGNVKLLNQRNIGGLALHDRSNDTLVDLLHPDELAKLYQNAFKLLFAFAISSQLNDPKTLPLSPTTISRELTMQTFVMNEYWCRVFQGGCLLVAVLTILLLYSAWGRQCNLDGEPNSLLESMLVIAANHELSQQLHNSEYFPDEMQEILTRSTQRYHLRWVQGQSPMIENIHKDDPYEPSRVLGAPGTEDILPQRSSEQWFFSTWAKIFFFIYFMIIFVLLQYLRFYEKKFDGLPTIAPLNSFGYKALFAYMPTIIGMIIDPFLGALGSYACMVGPYELLTSHPGSSRSSRTLVLDYDKTPPHFQIFQSLKSRNWVVSAISIAILLANVLAVAFGGLFSPKISLVDRETVVSRYNSPAIVQGFNSSHGRFSTGYLETKVQQEMYYLLTAYLSGNSLLPRWTTMDSYIIPFNISTPGSQMDSYQGTTWALGANISCNLVLEDLYVLNDTTPAYPPPKPNNKPSNTTNVSHRHEIRLNHPCWGDSVLLAAVSDFTGSGQMVKPYHAWTEEINPTTDFIARSINCPGTFFAGWGERPGYPSLANQPESSLNPVDYVVLECSAGMNITEVVVTIDSAENVIKGSNSPNAPQAEVQNFFRPGTSWDTTNALVNFTMGFQEVLAREMRSIYGYGGSTPGLLPDVFSKDSIYTIDKVFNPHWLMWFNALMAQMEPRVRRHPTNSTHLPNTAYVGKTFEDVYKSLFAINLQLYADIYFDYGDRQSDTINGGTIRNREDRVAVSQVMYAIATGILAFILVTLVYLYLKRPGLSLIRLPTSLADTYALLYTSNAKEDSKVLYGDNPNERASKFLGLGNTYGCGPFIGKDMLQHVGIYKATSANEGREIKGPTVQVGTAREIYEDNSGQRLLSGHQIDRSNLNTP